MNSLWISSNSLSQKFSPLGENKTVNVCIIGAGVFGITCAYYLTKLGFSVAVLEKDWVGHKTPGHTTAKITSQHNLFYRYLINSYGIDFSKNYLNSNEEAIQNIASIIKEENISYNFEGLTPIE